MWEIREMAASDVPEVSRLLRQLDELFQSRHDLNEDKIASTFRRMSRQPEVYGNYSMVSEGVIAGFLSMVMYKTFFHEGDTALISELVVADGYRGKGFGGFLVEKALRIAKSRGINEVEVSTTCGNRRAIDFYKNQGLSDESLLLGKELKA